MTFEPDFGLQFSNVEEPIPGAISTRFEHGYAVVTLSGEHDLATSEAVEAALRAAAARSSEVVVDLSTCTFIDCTILRAISRVAVIASVSVDAPPGTAPVVRLLLDLLTEELSSPPPPPAP